MKAKIIVVEDNPMNLRLLEQALGLAGYAIVSSVDGEGLVDLVVNESGRLVLMDIQLPKYSGVDLLKVLRADDRTKSLPVVAVTAFADPASVKGFLRDGFDQVVTKPISIQGLLSVIKDQLTRARQGS